MSKEYKVIIEKLEILIEAQEKQNNVVTSPMGIGSFEKFNDVFQKKLYPQPCPKCKPTTYHYNDEKCPMDKEVIAQKDLDKLLEIIWGFRTDSWWTDNLTGEFTEAGIHSSRIGCWCLHKGDLVDITKLDYKHDKKCVEARELFKK